MTLLTTPTRIAPRLGAALLTLALALAMVSGYRAALVRTERAVHATLARSAQLL
jgi:hypothetical protein